MSNFIRHLPCPKCRSKDNLGEYEDHFYCFGCQYHKFKNDLDTFLLRKRVQRNQNDPVM
jgi:twinkle protein